jgi:LacI family transcriptional regulator
MAKRVTLKDIARRTGLALSTISMALNDHPHITPETKKMVRETAEQLCYRPHPAARALARRQTALIGLVLQNVMSSFYPEVIQGVEDVAMVNTLSTILCNTNQRTDKEVEYLAGLLDRGVDGIILEPHYDQQDRSILEEIQNREIPVVTILLAKNGFDFPSVIVDNELGGYVATRYLIDKGHRVIGHLRGPDYSDTSEPRLRGYLRAMKEADLEVQPDWVVPSDFNPDSGRECMGRLVESVPKVSAVFVSGDVTALGAISELQHRGMIVPDDMSVVGFDGLFFGQLVEPKLTTVSQPRYEIGELAASMLLDMVAGRPVESVVLKPQLCIGTSA